MVMVSVKWQKQNFENLEIDTSQPPLVFKGQLYALTGVPTERQKIMVKGGLMQDEGDWAKYAVKPGQKLMMMGTADAIPVAPEKVPVFVEDLPEEDQEGAAAECTAGLVNLGNTCYMNSTLQCLHAVPELKTALTSYSASEGVNVDASHRLTLATKDLFQELDKSTRPVPPHRFLMLLREKFPQFAQTGEHGTFMQQDAEECWTQLMYTLSQRLRDTTKPSEAVMNQLFGIEMRNSMSCIESGEESSEAETVYTLKCHITGEVNLLHEGLKGGLKGELEKVSPLLGRSAVYTKSSLISKLPMYLTVQFVRFFWKRESQQKAKILRKVGYPLILDVYDFCTPELKSTLDGPRKRRLTYDDEQSKLATEAKARVKEGANGNGSVENAASRSKDAMAVDSSSKAASAGASFAAAAAAQGPADGDTEMTDGAKAEEVSGGASNGAAGSSSSARPTTASGGGGDQTGMFDLVAVLTHKGRSADSGHYVAWVKQESGKWIEFDDENPIMRREEDITNLSGGGDWHMAYILVYKARLAPSVA
eukprot:TRINITY_DN2673_c0_g1_i1.p1 TRINITY_DN2673_c0_g1~~TRINITY_DN2673_c0_g1_i1.p1  ORF type:complete len:535 (-),score=142.19 TRINITY_DN2673_c0_g1_i1:261-1865(-)